ncbi:Axonemal dynein light intermediate polypeptide 1 [Geranomyces variabilis]|nr:Axonemal dynein light intermediate polypeptide 1 [Geranomyces variabilis]
MPLYELVCIARAAAGRSALHARKPAAVATGLSSFLDRSASSAQQPPATPELAPLDQTRALIKESAIQVLDSRGVVKGFELLHTNQPLPYRMKRHQEIFDSGDYWCMQFFSSPETRKKLSKSLDFDERVIRHTIMKVGESMSEITGYTPPERLPSHSLVKYDNPVLVSRTDGGVGGKTPLKGAHAGGPGAGGGGIDGAGKRLPPVVGGKKQLPPVDDKSRPKTPSQTEDILNSILPPREWDETGQLWVQKVSSTPATRLDVINLQEQLDHMLQKRQARETGIDPVRRELYSQCFDELIRQVTISCQERGLLLLRVRDEIRMSIAAYQTLYESSVAFGMRKALQAEQGKSDMENRIKELEEEKRGLEQSVLELKAKCEAIEKRESERRAMEERKHAEEIAFLKKTNVQLKTQLEGILSPQKK